MDAEGTGRKQYIASVGVNSSKTITLVVQNAVNGEYEKIQIGQKDFASHVYNTYEWIIDNLIAITAGDYDGDGKDSIIIYVCGNGDNVTLMEFTRGTDGKWYGKDILDFSDVLKETRYKTASQSKYKPCVSLATGDFNGDGRDQLAFSAGFYNTSDDEEVGYVDYACDNLEQFATCVGIGSPSLLGGWVFEDPIWLYDEHINDYTGSSNNRTYPVTIMHAGSICAGDVNNYGVDEIVAAGYVDRTKDDTSDYFARATRKNGKITSVSYVSNFSASLLVSCVIGRAGDGYDRSDLTTFNMNTAHQHTHDNFCNNEDWLFTKIAMACGRTNGKNTRADVFIDGDLYDFSASTPKLVHETSFMSNKQEYLVGTLGSLSSVNFVRRVSVGNFNGNDAGREQFVFTFWQKSKGNSNYSSIIGVVTGVEYDDKKDGDNVVSYGKPEFYGSSLNIRGLVGLAVTSYTDTDGSSLARAKVVVHMIASTDDPINSTPVAVDIDDDGVRGRFSKSGYVYTDPEVLAVLEAGPYYSEIKDAGGYEDPCETSYSIGVGFGTSTSRGDSVSFEVGFAGEVAAGPMKVSLEAGYAMDWSKSYEESYTITQTDKFAAQSKDLVVLTRIPVLIYTYDIWDAAKSKWIENGMSVRVPLTPRYYMLGIDAYNDFVDEFNAFLGDKTEYYLIKINKSKDLPADHEGNPDKYWTDWSQAGYGAKALTDNYYELCHDDGNSGCEYTVEAAKTEAEEMSHGFHFGLTVQGGGDFGPAGEAWAGGYMNLDYRHSTGRSTTEINVSSSGGQVQNINADAITGLTRTQIEKGYYFVWTFGKWTRKLMESGGQVPFYGYLVKDVAQRPKATISTQPKDVTVAAGETAKFTVKAKGLGMSYQWYYRKTASDSWTAVSASSGKKATYSLTAAERHNGYQYRCRVKNPAGNTYTKAVTLTVLTKPTITTQPGDVSVAAGKTAKFTVAATGGDLSYQWYYRTSSTGSWTAVSASSGKTAAYSLTAADRHNGYQYRCRVKNAAGTTYTKAVTLTIVTKPVIATQPKSVSVAAGKTAKFTVEATGVDLSYQWYYRTSSTGEWTAVSAASGKTAAYSLTAADRHNGYQYRCRVKNAAGTTYTKAVTLTILTKPVISTQPKNVSVAAGKEAKFTVTATGSGLTYQWYYRKTSADSWTAVSAASGKTATYTMTAAARHNGYQYRCKVTNDAGYVYTKTVTLTVTAAQ